jgi:hypothetical protein
MIASLGQPAGWDGAELELTHDTVPMLFVSYVIGYLAGWDAAEAGRDA